MESYWLLSLFIQYGYLLVFAAVFLDNAGLPLPGELALLAFGFLARTGHVSVSWGVIVAAVGAMAGDTLGYWLGRASGLRLLRTYCRMTLGSGECVNKAVAYYQRFGPIAVLVGRFVIGVRAFLMPLAGSARVPYPQFVLFDAVGALVWSSVFIVGGYVLGNEVAKFTTRVRRLEILLGSMLAVAFAVYLGLKLSKRHRFGVGSLDRRSI